MSPQTRTREHKRGIMDKKVTIKKIMPIRRSETKVFLTVPLILGHKPTSSKHSRFSSIAHTKSSDISMLIN